MLYLAEKSIKFIKMCSVYTFYPFQKHMGSSSNLKYL